MMIGKILTDDLLLDIRSIISPGDQITLCYYNFDQTELLGMGIVRVLSVTPRQCRYQLVGDIHTFREDAKGDVQVKEMSQDSLDEDDEEEVIIIDKPIQTT